MPDNYNAAGAAAGGAIEDFMMQKAQQKRQAMLDQLNAQHAVDVHNMDLEQLQDMKDKAQERKDANVDKVAAKKRADVEKTLAGMHRGEMLHPETIAQAKESGVTLPQEVMPSMGVPPQPQPQIVPAMGAPTPPVAPLNPLPLRFGGTKPEQALGKYIEGQPEGSIPRKIAEAKQAGVNLTAADLKLENPSSNMVPVMTREQALAAKNIPANTKIEEPLPPKDNSARDAAIEARKDAARTKVYNTAITELEKRAKPFEDQLTALNTLGVALASNSDKSDAIIAPLLLKATIAGGGIRITQPEINSELSGSRTTWQSLQLKLGKLSDGEPIVLLPEEKKQIRDLARNLRTKAFAQAAKITKARHHLDTLEDPREIQKAATDLQDEMDKADPDLPDTRKPEDFWKP